MERFVVLTGGPGGGKSTLLAALAARGHHVMPEAGRAIIRDQAAIGGSLRADPVAFAEAILVWELRSYREAVGRDGLVFFDRGVPDVAGTYRRLGRPVPAHVDNAAARFRYAPTVFAAPPWPEIYVTDEERTQPFAEAVATYDAVVAAYRHYGYDVVDLPLVPVEERVAFLLDRLR